jgi:GT2 family glycosyltransferase
MSDLDPFPPAPDDDGAAAASAATVQEIYAELAPERLGREQSVPDEPPVPETVLQAHAVHVLLVCHDGERWLPRALDALAASDLAPRSVTAVDTGSTDATPDILGQSAVVTEVLTLPSDAGFAPALAAAAARVRSRVASPSAEEPAWYWVLHDDSAPYPDALRRLLSDAIELDAAVAGPKVLSWDRRRQLIEMGVSITGSGRRHTGLERREYDQGQHDDRRDVLAVGSAGMLVRREVWESLDGFDPQIELFRDDTDFGWRARLAGHRVVVVPSAVLEHVEAAAHGRRRRGALQQRAQVVDRRNALHVLLANAGTWTFPLVLLRAVVGSLLRAIGFVLGKVPGLAYDEMLALSGALRPGRLRKARQWRRGQRGGGVVHGLRPTLGHQLRQAVDNLVGLLAGTGAGQDVLGARRRALPGIPMFEEEDEPLPTGEGLVLRALTRPGFLLVLVAGLATLVASRGLIGPGRLFGGALLPAPSAAGDLWATYLAGWHPVGMGSATGAPPYLGVLSGGAAALLGSAPAAVTVLVLLSVPLAAGTAYRALTGVVVSVPIRLWASATYALLLVATGAVSAGRLGTCVTAVLAPLLVRAVARAVRPAAPLRHAWSASFLLAVTAAFTPVVWPVLTVTSVVAVSLVARSLAAIVRLGIVALPPLVLLLPWTLDWLARPELLVMEPGRTGIGAELSDPALPAWAPLVLAPGGPGSLPMGLLAGIPLLALAAWAPTSQRRPVAVGWLLALTAFAAAVVTSRVEVSAPAGEGPAAGWPGPAVILAGLALLGTIAVAGDGVRLPARGRGWSTRLRSRPRLVLLVAVVVAVATTATIVVGGLGRGLGDPLRRDDPAVLPVYVQDEAVGPDRVRTLVLQGQGADEALAVGFALVRDRGPEIGDAEVADTSADEALGAVVGDLLSGRGTTAAGALAAFGIRYVYVPAPADPGIVDALDGQAGLVRASAPDGGAVWRVEGITGRVRLLGPREAPGEPVGVLVPSGQVEVRTDIDTRGAQTVVLAERDDPGWQATLDGVPLVRADLPGGLLAFSLPKGSGELVVEYSDPERSRWLAVQAVALVVLLVLMLPAVRRAEDEVEDVAELDEVDSPAPRRVSP